MLQQHSLYTAQFDTPIGSCRLASSERGLAYVELPRASGRGFEGWRRLHLPNVNCQQDVGPNRKAIEQLQGFLEGERTHFELELDVLGTPFQREVWKVLKEIDYGETRTYAEIASRVGRPKAVRAVGNANGANPLSLVVPCHRVVATGGKLGGYGGGLELKARLLAMEGAMRDGQSRLL